MYYGVVQLDITVKSHPSQFGKTAATFGYSQGMYKHKLLGVIEVDSGHRSIWLGYYGVVQLDTTVEGHPSWFRASAINFGYSQGTHNHLIISECHWSWFRTEINLAWVLWSCATRHNSLKSSKSIWKECSEVQVFSGYAQTQNTECCQSRFRTEINLAQVLWVVQLDTTVESPPSWFGKTAATFGYSQGMHKHKLLGVVKVDPGQRSIWIEYYGVAQLDTTVESHPSQFEKSIMHLPHTCPTHALYTSTSYHPTTPLCNTFVYSTMSTLTSIDNQSWDIRVDSMVLSKTKIPNTRMHDTFTQQWVVQVNILYCVTTLNTKQWNKEYGYPMPSHPSQLACFCWSANTK